MRKPLLLAATAATTAVLVMSPLATAFAATHDVLTTGKVGGPNVKVGAVLKAGLKAGTAATFYMPGTTKGIKCTTSTVTSKVTTNPTKPGKAVLSLTAQTFAGCTSNIAGVTKVQSLTDNKLPYKVTISDATALPVTVFGPSSTIKLSTIIGPITCVYSAKTIIGHASNTGQVDSFSKQVLTKSGGSSLCSMFPKGAFSATYGPVVDTSVTGHPHVFVN